MSGVPRDLRVEALTRVEGEGALRVIVDGDTVTAAQLSIYEPPRFFEAMLHGRRHDEVADITSRICGICPVAYQTSAWNAIEDACGVRPPAPIGALRRLLYTGEWVSSHALHVYFLHAPDFLGYPDVVSMTAAHREQVMRGLRLKKVGNAILETVGGRAIHPVNTRLGGFHRAPTRADLEILAAQLRPAYDDAVETVRWVAEFDFPDDDMDCEFVALQHPDHYAIEDGVIARTGGAPFVPAQFLEHVVENQVPHSTALHAHLDGAPYLTGPLARYSLNSAQLPPELRALAAEAGLGDTCRSPARSVVVRAIETAYAVGEALRIIDTYERPDPPAVPVEPRAGIGHGVSEAPRGLLYHRYQLAADGTVRAATIVPPTSQNQAAIEDDLRRVASANLALDDAALTDVCERTIRHYDPCISCSTHFLRLTREAR